MNIITHSCTWRTLSPTLFLEHRRAEGKVCGGNCTAQQHPHPPPASPFDNTYNVWAEPRFMTSQTSKGSPNEAHIPKSSPPTAFSLTTANCQKCRSKTLLSFHCMMPGELRLVPSSNSRSGRTTLSHCYQTALQKKSVASPHLPPHALTHRSAILQLFIFHIDVPLNCCLERQVDPITYQRIPFIFEPKRVVRPWIAPRSPRMGLVVHTPTLPRTLILHLALMKCLVSAQ